MVSFDQHSQNVDNQYNAQIIQNIILVGRFLDFTKVEGLIPKPSASADFESISAVFEETFDKRLGGDLATATAFAGKILAPVIAPNWIPKETSVAFPFRKVLAECPKILFDGLSRLGYWDSFCSSQSYGDECQEIIWFRSMSLLWIRHFHAERLFGIGRSSYDAYARWLDPCFFESVASLGRSSYRLSTLDPQQLTNEEFRVFMAGLVIDLIRMASTTADDTQFWIGLVDLLSPGGQ